MNCCILFMMQGFYWMFVHGAERGHDHAEGDDGEKQKVLDGGYNEEMRPELRHPVFILSRYTSAETIGESDVHGELKPDNLSDDGGNERQ